jgi:dienelactone hydrolase
LTPWPFSKQTIGDRMNKQPCRLSAIVTLLCFGSCAAAWAQPTFPKPERYTPTAREDAEIKARIDALMIRLVALPSEESSQRDAWADVAVYHNAAVWALRGGEFYRPGDVAATLRVLDRGLARARQAADGGRTPWVDLKGSTVRGYRSRVDGSVQPYAVIVPEGLVAGPERRARLDVILHGRGATLNEVHFIELHDGKPAPAESAGKITLHVFGRGNNAYRWAGETDVFEAIDTVKRLYPIDEERVVLRGFSMGGAGAWHLGLHHPALWSSVEAGAGFSETKTYAKLGKISEVQDRALRIYDSVAYALNAVNVPMAGYGGEKDPQRQASLNIENALKGLGFTMKTEGLVIRGENIDFLRVEGAGMGHAVDPASRKILDAFHDQHAVTGVDLKAKRIRFTTFTLRYARADWLAIEELGEHYTRALVDAEVKGSQVVVNQLENVVALSVDRRMGQTIRLGGEEFPLESAVKGLLPNVYFRLENKAWRQLDYDDSRAFEENSALRKRRGVQGPIDDAFSTAFLCVRGTGTPWNPKGQAWSDSRLKQFADDWRVNLRGEVRIKDDAAVGDEDIDGHNLVLFGDPGSNRVLARMLKDLPMTWTRAEIRLGGTFSSSDHVPVLIAANPLNPRRYVVVNSGHTFGAKDFAGTNALLFPRLGDYAVFRLGDETPRTTGFFDERWKAK